MQDHAQDDPHDAEQPPSNLPILSDRGGAGCRLPAARGVQCARSLLVGSLDRRPHRRWADLIRSRVFSPTADEWKPNNVAQVEPTTNNPRARTAHSELCCAQIMEDCRARGPSFVFTSIRRAEPSP